MTEAERIQLRVYRSFKALYLGMVRELAFLGNQIPGYWWDTLEESVRLLLQWADISAAARLRFDGLGLKTAMPSDSITEIVDANPYLREHVRQSSPVVEFRAKLTRQAEYVYLMRRAMMQRMRQTKIPAAALPQLAEYRTERVRRDTVGEIVSVSQQIELCDPLVSEMFPFSRWQTRCDLRVRPTHALMERFVAARSWPGWKIILPPAGYNERCTLRHIARFEARKNGWLEKSGRPNFDVKWPNSASEENFNTGRFPDKGFQGPKFTAPGGPLTAVA